MVDISKGFTFYDDITAGITTGYTADATLLQAMVSSALVTSFEAGEFRNDGNDTNKAIPFHVTNSQVGPSTQQSGGTTYYDTTNDFVRVEQGQGFHGQFDFINVVNNNASETLTAGSLVRQVGQLGQVPKVDFTSSQGYPDTLGVVLADIAALGAGLVRKYGLMEVNVTGGFTAGDLLVSSATTGHAESIQNVSGYPTVTHGVGLGQCLKAVASGNTIVTCYVYL